MKKRKKYVLIGKLPESQVEPRREFPTSGAAKRFVKSQFDRVNLYVAGSVAYCNCYSGHSYSRIIIRKEVMK